MSTENKNKLINMLDINPMKTKDVGLYIKEEFEINYSMKQVHVIFSEKEFCHAKSYPQDYRRPYNVTEILKKPRYALDTEKTEPFIVGFMDETSPQTVANTVRLLSPPKPAPINNTTKIRTNAVRFFAINSSSVINFPNRLEIEDTCILLDM